MTAAGISIDDLDQFTIAVSDNEILSRGHFEVREPLSVSVTLSGTSLSRLKPGRFWSALKEEGEGSLALVKAAFSALKIASETAGKSPLSFRACVLTSPLALSTSQKDLLSSALKEIFGCVDDTFVVREVSAIISALRIEPEDVEDSSIAIVLNESTYILGEDFSMALVLDTFPPPVNLELVTTKHNIRKIIFVQDSSEPKIGQSYGSSEIPIQYEPSDIIARGAALMATLALPGKPVSILPLPLGIVLHGSLLHIVIPIFSVLPKQAKVTLTTVHHNQRTVVIEIREGLRARAADNLFITTLHLEDISPAPAGTISIEVTLTVEYNDRIVVEAVEPLSGRKAEIVVERDYPIYPEGVLEDQQAAGEKYMEQDAQFRASMFKKVSREIQPEDAVQLFVNPPSKHEEL